MKPNSYKVLELAVEQGVTYGYHRAFKHDSNPPDEFAIAEIENSVMTHICEWFDFNFED